jgi:fused signal recognition particle receptor
MLKGLARSLERARQGIWQRVAQALPATTAPSAAELDQLEGLLLSADVGPAAAGRLMAAVREGRTGGTAAERLRTGMLAILKFEPRFRIPDYHFWAKPEIWLVLGVNGSGKTTTIAKLGRAFGQAGARVMVAAADTYRAAAAEQLRIWAERTGAEFIGSKPGADPASVAFDAAAAAKARGVDLLLVDTAGRLHNKKHLRDELAKVRASIGKSLPGAPHQSLLVMDATTGQSGLSQVKLFSEAVPVDGIVLTKLDGTAKGGIVLAIALELGIPVAYVGTGESLEDLAAFEPGEFVDGLLG